MREVIMASTAIAPSSASTRTERYLEAERSLWEHYGLEPEERFVDLDAPSARLRVLEVGSGEPVLFVHGTVGPGGWASLISELPGFRSIVLERPGWGLSSAVDFSGQDYGKLVAEVLRGALDALELEWAHVVGGSIGNVWALRLAAHHPSRVRRVVLLGAGPIVSEARVPGIIRLLASPAGALMVRMPGNRSRLRSILRKSGHGPSLDDGRIPDEFVDWRVRLERETDSMRHERDMVCAIVKGKSYRPGLTFDDAELVAIRQPTLHVHGTSDETVGSAESWPRVADALPRGELRLVK
ncbi:MAG TPA: alpha/beta hydrolase, partial [Gaiellaceae bacterium]|nr:alpha/beta hydrolase [Gaiellaceae bacterium]